MNTRLDDRNRHLLALMRDDDRELMSVISACIASEDTLRQIRGIIERRDRRAIVATLVRIPESGDEASATVIEDPNRYSNGQQVTSSVEMNEERLYVINEPPASGSGQGAVPDPDRVESGADADRLAADLERYRWARGKRLIRMNAYGLSELSADGSVIDESVLRTLHLRLMELWILLEESTVGELGADVVTEEQERACYASYNVYSDGSAVASLARVCPDAGPLSAPEYFEGDIGQYHWPKGWDVRVSPPPHHRSEDASAHVGEETSNE